MLLRSFNPALKTHFRKTARPQFLYGFRNVINADACQSILDKLQLKDKYPNSEGRVDVIDVFSGHGLLSTMINYELKPRNHLLIEHYREHVKTWEDRIKYLKSHTQNSENFMLAPQDGHSWSTYDDLFLEKKIFEPEFQPRSKVHDQLLVVANLTSAKMGESLFAQWLMCIAHKNWLQKYGRVRMVVLAPETVVQKFFAGPYFIKRNRTSAKRGMFSDSKLIAIAQPDEHGPHSAGDGYDPRLVIKDQPVLLPSSSITPVGNELAVVEVIPKELDEVDVNEIDHLTQSMLFRMTNNIANAFKILAPGAEDDLVPKIPKETLHKKFKQLTDEEIWQLYNIYHKWEFKPRYEDTISVFLDDSRHF